MGRDFCTIPEASRRLSRSTRSIHAYVKKGLLRKGMRDGQVVVDREDVERLAEDLQQERPPPTARELWELMAKVRRLEMDVTVLRRMLGVEMDPLRASHEQLSSLLAAARAAGGAQAWDPRELQLWSGLFARMDEAFLLEADKLVPNPAELLLDLCVRMIAHAASRPNYETSLEWQECHQKLCAGRDRLRGSIAAWASLRPGRPALQPVTRTDRLAAALRG